MFQKISGNRQSLRIWRELPVWPITLPPHSERRNREGSPVWPTTSESTRMRFRNGCFGAARKSITPQQGPLNAAKEGKLVPHSAWRDTTVVCRTAEEGETVRILLHSGVV